MPLELTTVSWLAIAASVVATLALFIAALAWRRAGSAASKTTKSKPPRRSSSRPLSSDQVSAHLAALREDVATSLRHLAVVRYDAFGDMGGHLSWSIALLDDGGDGVVLTSISGRSDSRTYAKNISGWSAAQQLSPEEVEAIDFARTSTS
ncbi:MAG: DUF4446 family protein [Nocardioidaceae bacterium]